MYKVEALKREIAELEENLENVKSAAVKNVIKNMIVQKKKRLKKILLKEKLREETE